MAIVEPSGPAQYLTQPAGGGRVQEIVPREPPSRAPEARFLDRVRQALRARHMSRRTGEAYVAWIRRCIVFHDKRHPAEMSAPEVTKFLTSLTANEQVAASTQNEALSALLFLYGLEGYTHRDTLHGVAAFPDSRRPRRANASGWIERPESQ